MGTWYNDLNPGPTNQEKGAADIQGGLDRIYSHVAPIQTRNEERAYQEKQAADGRARTEAALDKPVDPGVNDFLNQLGERVRAGKNRGQTAGLIAKMVQAGVIPRAEAEAILDREDLEMPDVPPAPMGAPGAPVGPQVGGPPLPTGKPIVEPGGAPAPIQGMMNPTAPPPAQAAPQRPQPVQAPPPPTVGAGNSPPSAPPRQWTQRGLNQLGQIPGGMMKDPELSEGRLALEILKERGRDTRNTGDNTSRETIADGKNTAQLKAVKDKIVAAADIANKRNTTALEIAKMRASSLLAKSSGTSPIQAKVRSLTAELNAIQSASAKIRSSITGSDTDMQNLPKLEAFETRIHEITQELDEAREQMGKGTNSSTVEIKTGAAARPAGRFSLDATQGLPKSTDEEVQELDAAFSNME